MTGMKTKLDVSMVKDQNRRLVFEEIANHAPTTRLAIARSTHLSVGTVKTIIEELMEYGVAREKKASRSAVGRKPHQVEFLPRAKKILCIDLATKNPACVLKDLSLCTEKTAAEWNMHECSQHGESYEQYLRRFFKEIKGSFLSPEDESALIGVGISVPGPYRADTDKVSCKLIPAINEVRIGSLVREYFGPAILIDHDVKLAASSEVRLIPDFDKKTIFYLYLDEGVGSAISINGSIFGGAREFAGEIGQMRIDGEGNLEEAVSWNSFLQRLSIANLSTEGQTEEAVDHLLSELYEHGDRRIDAELDFVTSTVAKALANVIVMMNPHEIIISGHYRIFGAGFIERIEKKTDAYLLDEMREGLVFRSSSYLEKGSLIGAAGMVRDRWLLGNHLKGGAV